MEIDRRELKRRAREAMGQARPRSWLVALLYILMTSGVSLLLSALLPPTNVTGLLFANILMSLYGVVAAFGYKLWCLWAWRKLDPGAGTLLQGFSVAGRVVVMELLVFVRILGWSFVIGMLAAPLLILLPFAYPILAIAVAVATVAIQLRYVMAPYLLADHPDDGAGAAVARSVAMMRGRKWELFKLRLSFIGWELINALLNLAILLYLFQSSSALSPQGTGELISYYSLLLNSLPYLLASTLVTLPLTLWLSPYIGVSEAGFYDTFRDAPSPVQPEMPPL